MSKEPEPEGTPQKLEKARVLLDRARQAFAGKSFRPHSLFRNGHVQTIAAYAWPRRFRFASESDEERLFEVEPGVKVLAHCRWQSERDKHATIVVWHGIEGSTGSNYMQAMAEKGFHAGFNVIRVNFRNCGGTEHLTNTIYHGGLSADLAAVVKELHDKDRVSRMFLVGFSLGGNLVLKPAGDDPFTPFAPLQDPFVSENPYILLLGPQHGGHVAFISAQREVDNDRFWAENRAVEFFKLANEIS